MAVNNPAVTSSDLNSSTLQTPLYKPSHRAMVESMDIMSYLKALPASIWSFLFSNSATLQAILRSLNELDQQIIMRLCYIHHTVSEKAMRLWVHTESLTELRRSISLLVNLHILTISDNKRSDSSQYTLESTIKKQIQEILLNGPSPETLKYILPVPDTYFTGKHKRPRPSKSILINHSQTRWDNLLRFIVSPNETNKSSDSGQDLFFNFSQAIESQPERPCEEVVFILVRRHLLSYQSAYTSTTGERSMSREAFSWLLKDLRSQIISIIMEFLYIIDGGNLSTPAVHADARSTQNTQNTGKGNTLTFTTSQMNEKRNFLFPEIQNNSPEAVNHSGKDNKNEKASKASYKNFSNTSYKDITSKPNNSTPEQSHILNPIDRAAELTQQSLLFLLSISQASIGQPFYVNTLSPIQHRLLRVCLDIGLLWIPNKASNVYFVSPYSLLLRADGPVTRSLTAAMSSLSSGMSNPMKRRFINSNGKTPLYNTTLLGESWFHPAVWEDISSDTFNFDTKDLGPSISINPTHTQPMESSIIVQSNFKVYIYTSSALHISVLSHLCELQARTTNLVVGILTRESVSAAYKSGITADQIIRFLESHSHPAIYEHQMQAKQNPLVSTSQSQISSFNHPLNSNPYVSQSDSLHLLPENIIIQLKMWEAEQNRLTMEGAVLFKSWQNDLLPELFQKCVRWAIGKGYCLHYTQWPEDIDSEEFEEWMKLEKYLCVNIEAKSEMIEKYREFRELILSVKSGKTDLASADMDEYSVGSKIYGFE